MTKLLSKRFSINSLGTNRAEQVKGVGIFSAEFQIRDPDGKIAHAETLAAAQKLSAEENHGIAVTMAPFVVSAFGTYRLILALDGKRYKRTLTIDPDTEAISSKTAH